MANWLKPTLPDPYPDFLDSLVARDLDSGTMFLVDPTNPPVGLIRYNRSINAFQEWNGSSWITKLISVEGGGTGSSTSQSLGTMASQNANNVNITGGNVQGLSSLINNGNTGLYGAVWIGSGNIQQFQGDGRLSSLRSSNLYDTNAQDLTNINASQLTHGTVYRDRLGSGAVGSGNKVLVDNGTWIDKNSLGGGMIEILHGSYTFPYNEFNLVVPLSWASNPMPTSAKEVSLQINNVAYMGNASSGTMQTAYWYVTGPTSFNIGRVYSPQSGGAPEEYTFHFTAFHHKVS